jgi:hypothetical protein
MGYSHTILGVAGLGYDIRRSTQVYKSE